MDWPARLLAPTRVHHSDSAPSHKTLRCIPVQGQKGGGGDASKHWLTLSFEALLVLSWSSQTIALRIYPNSLTGANWSKLQPCDLFLARQTRTC